MWTEQVDWTAAHAPTSNFFKPFLIKVNIKVCVTQLKNWQETLAFYMLKELPPVLHLGTCSEISLFC